MAYTVTECTITKQINLYKSIKSGAKNLISHDIVITDLGLYWPIQTREKPHAEDEKSSTWGKNPNGNWQYSTIAKG